MEVFRNSIGAVRTGAQKWSKDTMKILQINAVNGIRSTGRTCAEMSAYFQKTGIQCRTAYSVGNNSFGDIPVASAIECKYHALMSRISGMQAYHSPVSTAKLIRSINDMKPDVVVLRNLHANYLNIVPLLRHLGKKSIPTVAVLHDCWLFTGKCTHYNAIGCRKWEKGCSGCPQLKADHKSWLFDRTKRMWQDKYRGFRGIEKLAVVGVSDWITKEATRSPFFSHARFQRIYNWIDLQTFCPGESNVKKQLGIENCKMILGVSSGWSSKKGLDHFISLASTLAADEKLVLVGNMPPIELPENVITVPETANVAELVEYYRAADVFLQLSREETFGKVVAEALSCGTPVITNRFTANPELVNADCGTVLEELTAPEISRAVHQVLANGKEHYTKACVSFAAAHFDKDKNLAQYHDLFKTLCE